MAKKTATKSYGTRSDKGSSADAYFDEVPPELQDIARSLRAIVASACPRAGEVIKWGIPVYELDGDKSRGVCAIYAAKKHVNLQFYKGAHLDDPEGLLEGTGKDLRHVKVRGPKDIKKGAFTKLLKQAAKLEA